MPIWGIASVLLSLIAIYSGPFPCKEAVVLGSFYSISNSYEQDVQVWGSDGRIAC